MQWQWQAHVLNTDNGGLTFKSVLCTAGFCHFLWLEREEAVYHLSTFSLSKSFFPETFIVEHCRRFRPERGPHRMWEFCFVNTVVAGCHFEDASSYQGWVASFSGKMISEDCCTTLHEITAECTILSVVIYAVEKNGQKWSKIRILDKNWI